VTTAVNVVNAGAIMTTATGKAKRVVDLRAMN
jgi:phenylacetate-CoA ligase